MINWTRSNCLRWISRLRICTSFRRNSKKKKILTQVFQPASEWSAGAEQSLCGLSWLLTIIKLTLFDLVWPLTTSNSSHSTLRRECFENRPLRRTMGWNHCDRYMGAHWPENQTARISSSSPAPAIPSREASGFVWRGCRHTSAMQILVCSKLCIILKRPNGSTTTSTFKRAGDQLPTSSTDAIWPKGEINMTCQSPWPSWDGPSGCFLNWDHSSHVGETHQLWQEPKQPCLLSFSLSAWEVRRQVWMHVWWEEMKITPLAAAS